MTYSTYARCSICSHSIIIRHFKQTLQSPLLAIITFYESTADKSTRVSENYYTVSQNGHLLIFLNNSVKNY